MLLPDLVGFAGFGTNHTDPDHPLAFSLPIPTGTRSGDLLVASIMTKATVMVPPGRGLVEVYSDDNAYDDWKYGVWAGPWDGDSTPIAWEGSGWLNAVGQFFAAFLAAFRDRTDSTRTQVHSIGPTVPGLSGEGPALCVNWIRAGIAGTGGMNPFLGTDWAEAGNADAAYCRGTIAINGGVISDETAIDSGAVGGLSNTGPYITFGVLPFGLAPPCRLTGREDQLGVGSGRIWPPAKSHQASPRRAGGYY